MIRRTNKILWPRPLLALVIVILWGHMWNPAVAAHKRDLANVARVQFAHAISRLAHLQQYGLYSRTHYYLPVLTGEATDIDTVDAEFVAPNRERVIDREVPRVVPKAWHPTLTETIRVGNAECFHTPPSWQCGPARPVNGLDEVRNYTGGGLARTRLSAAP